MRDFTIFLAIVVGLTWALTTVCSADSDYSQPIRILNPFRKNAKGFKPKDGSHMIPRHRDMYEGNPINAQRFSRKLDDELAKERRPSEHRAGGLHVNTILEKK